MAWNNNTGRTSSWQWRKIRQKAKKALDYRCAVCGTSENLELDHKINVKSGGTNELTNLQWLCTGHHKQKTQKEATKARMAWKLQPERHPGLK